MTFCCFTEYVFQLLHLACSPMPPKHTKEAPAHPDRFIWSPELDKSAIQAHLVVGQEGFQAGNGWKKQGWMWAMSLFNNSMRKDISLEQFKTWYYQLQVDFKLAAKMKKKSRWGWDETDCGG